MPERKRNIYHVALDCLAKRDLTALMLQNKLLQKGFSADSIQVALQRLVQEGLVNEERFCEDFIAKRIRQGYGPVRIAAELNQQGVNKEIVSSLLQQSESLCLDSIKKIQQKKFSSSVTNSKESLRQINYLKYRGFTLDQIKKSQKNRSDY